MQFLRKQSAIIGTVKLIALSLSLSPKHIFHLDVLTISNEVWIKLESLFGKQDDFSGHKLENELISLRPSEFKTIKEFITKFKSLVLLLKQCGIEKKEDQLIISILSKLGLKYSVFVSTFYATNLAVRNWRMPSLDAFIDSLTQEKIKLNQMGNLKTLKDHALVSLGSKNLKSK